MSSTTWAHAVRTPDTITMTIPDENTILVSSESELLEAAFLLDAVRNAAWQNASIPYNPNAALLRYAQRKGLGAPVTTEFDFTFEEVEYRGQGFAMGIAYCETGDWGNVLAALW